MDWQLRLSEFDIDVVRSADTKDKATNALLWLESRGTDITKLDDDIPKITVPLVDQRGGKINIDHFGNYNLFFVSQKCDSTFEKINSALSELTAIPYTKKMHMVLKKELERWKRFCKHRI